MQRAKIRPVGVGCGPSTTAKIAKIALQYILTFKVNAIGTPKTFLWPLYAPQPTTELNHQTWAKYAQNGTAVHLDCQSQWNWNCQNHCITPLAGVPLSVPISLPVPRDSFIHHSSAQIESADCSEVWPKLHCGSSWLSKSMQLELPKL
jgi:hypothetical protein